MSIACQHFGVCGGCRDQHLSYEEQLLLKEKVVRDLFSENGDEFFPIMATADPWRYRNKMEFSFSQSKDGQRFLGLMMKGRRGKVVNLEMCHITGKWMTLALSAVKKWWDESDLTAYYPPQDRGCLRTLTLREGLRTGEKMALLTTSGVPSQTLLDSFTKALLEIENFTSIIHIQQVLLKKSPTRFIETVLHGTDHIHECLFRDSETCLRFKIRAHSFFQPNSNQAERLYRRALELANLEKGETLLDLYCGTGSIGCFASFTVKQVLGIELNGDAVKDAHDNIALNGIPNMTVLQGDVGECIPLDLKISTVIVDPPRAGLSPQALLKLKMVAPQKIIYISCNPFTQAENIKDLTAAGYRITAIQPVDQFPHTPHIENIVALEALI